MSINESSYFKADIPVGQSGAWRIDRFVIEPRDAARRALDRERPPWARVYPGEYTVLKRGEELFMTDLYDEWWTQRNGIREACRRGGRALVTGLGLGLVAEGMLRTPVSRVSAVTVIEFSEDVIRLVGPHLQARLGDRLEIVHADAFTWRLPEGVRYSVGWHDIWPNPQDPDALTEAETLEQRYAPFCDWQGSWPRDYLITFGLLEGDA